jgi:error-prone DNA polymerase
MTNYVELHCHSNFSLLDGASHPEDLVVRAAGLEMEALALTDHDAVYGAVRFVEVARTRGIRPILGAELTLVGGSHLTLLVEDETGWGNLCWLISRARHNAPKGQPALPPAGLIGHTQGLIALSGCRQGEVAAALLRKDREGALAAARRYRDLFGQDRFWIELQHHLLPDDDALVDGLVGLARHLELGYVATNNVHYATRNGRQLQDVLVCIRHRTRLDEADPFLRPNSEFYLKPAWRMAPLFAAYPQALANTRRIAERCQFELRYGLQDLPRFPTPAGLDALTYLRRLCQDAVPARYPGPPSRVWEQLDHELAVIQRAGLANYFLIVWDLVHFARENGIRCQGRGSAANSMAAYLLGITPIDPLAHDLVFERFLSDARPPLPPGPPATYPGAQNGYACGPSAPSRHRLGSPGAGAGRTGQEGAGEGGIVPDIDIDFQANRREEVIQYVYRRYGPEHTAMACTLVTFRARSAWRDVSKALGLSPQATGGGLSPLITGGLSPELLSQTAEELDAAPTPEKAPADSGQRTADVSAASPPDQDPLVTVRALCRQIEGFPRHLGIHNGGMVITGPPLARRVPAEPATMPGRVVVQWDKEALETVGLVKIDLLGLRMLSAVAEAVEIVGETTGKSIDLDRLTFDDPAVYDMIASADTIGVFQVESRAQAQILPRLRPRRFEDLVVSISLIRPGPIQGNMVHPYLRRRLGLEPVTYPHPSLKPALAETLGVVLFQEQVLKVARDLAAFTPGQGEQLRRALGGKRGEAEIEAFRDTFLEGARARSVPEPVAEAVFAQLKAFGGYSFPKSHAAAFAVLVYQSAWLKCYYPAAFYTALLNNQPMGFWSPAVLVGDARRHGIRILPVDIQRSQARGKVEEMGIRLGLNYVHGLGEAGITRLEEARSAGAFDTLADFCRRTRLPRSAVENLILAGAMDGWGMPRRQLLWQLGRLHYHQEELDLVFPDEGVALPPLSLAEAMAAEYGMLGLSTGDHVMTLYRPWLVRHGILSSRELETSTDGGRVRAAGLVVMHQAPPTAKGHHFITLEDEEGLINVIVRPKIYTGYRHILHTAPLLIVEGMVQRRDSVVNLLALRVTALDRN